ncbi:MAG TPA: TrmH family RNA methyltransferase [Thermoanaerobaculia bacterium]|nr:TrmH family RNA methyltransferase [Thermoanaerobaculia bacterium]
MPPPSLAVVLVRPHTPANIGSVARAALNFGVLDLRLVEPAAPVDEESRRLASGADRVLEGLRRYERLEDAAADFEAVVATSSLRGRARQRFLSLADLPAFLERLGPTARTAFVFGPERSGLTEQERSHASACLRLPTQPDFPTLNLSHAVAVVLAVACLRAAPSPEPESSWAPASDVEAAVAHWDRALEAIGFYDTGHPERSLRDWRRIVAARPMSKREVALLRGVANRVLVSLRRL